MKKIILYSASLFFGIQSFCQTTSPASSKEYYLKKSKTQKTIGFVMVGAGVALIATGLITENHRVNNDPLEALTNTGPAILIVAGSGVALGSIPLFIGASKNKKRALAISFNSQPVYLPQQNVVAIKIQPRVSLKISL